MDLEIPKDDYRAAAGHLINAALARKRLYQQNFDQLVRFSRERLDSIGDRPRNKGPLQ